MTWTLKGAKREAKKKEISDTKKRVADEKEAKKRENADAKRRAAEEKEAKKREDVEKKRRIKEQKAMNKLTKSKSMTLTKKNADSEKQEPKISRHKSLSKLHSTVYEEEIEVVSIFSYK